MFNLNQRQSDYVILGLLVVVLVLVGTTFYFYQEQGTAESELTAEQAKQKASQYISENLLREGESATVEEATSTMGLYKLSLKVAGQNYESYLTKDGSMLFPSPGYNLTETQGDQESETESQSEEIPKKETAEVELFVQSFCPYGNQAEDTMKPVYELLGDKVNWEVNYIVSEENGSFDSLHGAKEVTQDKRELCVMENQSFSKWFDFVTYVNENCGSEGQCWEEGASKTGLSADSVTSCVDSQGSELLSEEASVTAERGVTASPTLFVNGVESEAVYQYGSPEAYKEAICSGFEEPPAECEEDLENVSDSSNGGSC